LSNEPLFTAAIICFNRRTMVRTAIESVLSQEVDDYELLLVDDASTDGSADVLREYADRATVIVREQNGGEMAARNSALAAVRGEYVCFLDSDDAWFPWTLATFAEAIRRHNRPAVVMGKVFSFRDEAQLNGVVRTAYTDSVASCYSSSNSYLGVPGGAIRRQAIEQVGGFVDLRLNCLDSDLMLRIGDQLGFVNIDSPHTFGYRDHDGIMCNSAMSYGGAMHLIESEIAGKYPGGEQLRNSRLRQIAVRTRNISMQLAQQGQWRESLDLYRRTLGWNIRFGHWAYILVLPLSIICPSLLKVKDRYTRWKRHRREIRNSQQHLDSASHDPAPSR
jgi:glycosyltransferase involved in cell wall biosynthesis